MYLGSTWEKNMRTSRRLSNGSRRAMRDGTKRVCQRPKTPAKISQSSTRDNLTAISFSAIPYMP
jgi:hypothetical protein